jgi:hypothetical protein
LENGKDESKELIAREIENVPEPYLLEYRILSDF